MATNYPYVLMAAFAFIEGGEVSLFFAGYLLHTYNLSLIPSAGIVLVAVLSSDVLWYYWGGAVYRLPFIRAVATRLARIDRHIVAGPLRVAFIARFSYGIHRLTIARFRANGLGFVRAFRILLTTSAVWLTIIGGLIVIAAETISSIRHYLHTIEIGIAAFVVLLLLFERFGLSFLGLEDTSTEATPADKE